MTDITAALIAAHTAIATSLTTALAGAARNPDDDEWSTMADCYRDSLNELEPVMALLNGAVAKPIRVVLDVSGGVVQGASIDGGAVDILLVDYEADDDDNEAVRIVPQSGGGEAVAEVHPLCGYEIDPAWVDAMFANQAAADASEDARDAGAEAAMFYGGDK